MTKILFHEDAYLKEHQTKVTQIEGNRVLLEEAIFFLKPQLSLEIRAK
jgi:Ser-tRNA(Ala) deacylase AlaX